MSDPKKPDKAPGVMDSLIDRLKDTMICGNKPRADDEESLLDASTSNSSSPFPDQESDVGPDHRSDDSRNQSSVAAVDTSPAVSTIPPNEEVAGGGSSGFSDDPNAGMPPSSSLRQRHQATPSSSSSASSTPTGSVFTPSPTSSPASTASSSSSISSLSRRIGKSPLGKAPATDDDVKSPPVIVERLNLGPPSEHRSVAGPPRPILRKPGQSRSTSPGSRVTFVGINSTGSSSASRTPKTSSAVRTTPSPGRAGSTPPQPQRQRRRLPHGNIFPKGIPKGVPLTRDVPRRDVLGTGKGIYGYGSVMWGTRPGCLPGGRGARDPAVWMTAGYAEYCKGNFDEAKRFYTRGIEMAPDNADFRCSKAELLRTMGWVWEAVSTLEVALVLDKKCLRAHHLLGNLLIELGQVEFARKHLSFPAVNPTEKEMQTLEAVEAHIGRCTAAYKNRDWLKVQEEADAAMTAGAYHSPQLLACRAECFLKLLQIEDALATLAVMATEPPNPNCCSESRIFDFLSASYPLYVRAQVELAFGRFGDAAVLAQKAAFLEPKNALLKALVDKIQAVTRARNRGNALVEAKKLAEACAAYDAGIALDPLNSTLHCNRGACSYMLKKWEQCVEDCTSALRTRPRYPKALQRRAFSYLKLEKWALAIQDYEILREQAPGNQEYADGLAQARAAWDKAREMVQEILSLEQFISLTSTNGVYVVHFFETSEEQECKILSSIMKVLNRRYPSITFLKVDVKKSSEISNAVNVKTVPIVKIYKDGACVKDVLNPCLDTLDEALRDCSK